MGFNPYFQQVETLNIHYKTKQNKKKKSIETSDFPRFYLQKQSQKSRTKKTHIKNKNKKHNPFNRNY